MAEDYSSLRSSLLTGIPADLPNHPGLDLSVDNAPNRRQILSKKQKKLALKNALRYFPKQHHGVLAEEFLAELDTFGRITYYLRRQWFCFSKLGAISVGDEISV